MNYALETKIFIKKILGLQKIGDALTIRKDDIFIASYPKSGNTWTRFLIANLIYQNEVIDFSNIEKKVPDIYVNNHKDLLRMNGRRYLKTHSCFNPKYPKVIYIVRDPRDVFVSNFYFNRKINNEFSQLSKIEYLDHFLNISSIYGTWEENVGSWIGSNKRNFLLIKYEDLTRNPINEINKLASFINIHRDRKEIESVSEKSSFMYMQNLEKRTGDKWSVSKNFKGENISFCRSGKINQWKSEICSSINEKFIQEYGKTMKLLNYI